MKEKRWYRCVEFESGTIMSAPNGLLNRLIKKQYVKENEGRIVRFFKEYR